MKSLIVSIMEQLGVVVGEEFFISDLDGNIWCDIVSQEEVRYKFDGNFLLKQSSETKKWYTDYVYLAQIIYGERKIVRLPFTPKKGERYYTYTFDWQVTWVDWEDNYFDCCNKLAGCIFRSAEEAEAALPIKFKELSGKRRGGCNDCKCT